ARGRPLSPRVERRAEPGLGIEERHGLGVAGRLQVEDECRWPVGRLVRTRGEIAGPGIEGDPPRIRGALERTLEAARAPIPDPHFSSFVAGGDTVALRE